MNTTVFVALTHIECWSCHGLYGLLEESRRRYEEKGDSWTCPYCAKSTGYVESTVERERKKREAAERSAQFWRDRSEEKQRSIVSLGHRVRAQKAAATKAKRRAAAALCPVPGCKRHFVNLSRHLATKHKGWAE